MAEQTMKTIDLAQADYAERYGLACDALCRALWADRYGIAEGDGLKHTSDEARRVATAVFDAIGVTSSGEDPWQAWAEKAVVKLNGKRDAHNDFTAVRESTEACAYADAIADVLHEACSKLVRLVQKRGEKVAEDETLTAFTVLHTVRLYLDNLADGQAAEGDPVWGIKCALMALEPGVKALSDACKVLDDAIDEASICDDCLTELDAEDDDDQGDDGE